MHPELNHALAQARIDDLRRSMRDQEPGANVMRRLVALVR